MLIAFSTGDSWHRVPSSRDRSWLRSIRLAGNFLRPTLHIPNTLHSTDSRWRLSRRLHFFRLIRIRVLNKTLETRPRGETRGSQKSNCEQRISKINQTRNPGHNRHDLQLVFVPNGRIQSLPLTARLCVVEFPFGQPNQVDQEHPISLQRHRTSISPIQI